MKDCTTCKYGYRDEQLGIPMCHHPSRFINDCIDFNMHEEKEVKEVKESEKPIAPNDLEEAAEEYTQRMLESWRFDSTGCRPPRESFIAGAKWQKEQMLKDAIEGKVAYFERKEVAVVHYDDPIGDTMCYFAPSDRLEVGDKVKIIIVKEEDER